VVPDVRPVAQLDEVLRGMPPCVMLVEPSVGIAAATLRDVPAFDRVTLLVGPEGGWTSQEVETAVASGTTLLTLGPRTLRAAAVPIVALTALRVHWEDD
jgi:16S rRNA (uracil1498-N3)-methyltransferase